MWCYGSEVRGGREVDGVTSQTWPGTRITVTFENITFPPSTWSVKKFRITRETFICICPLSSNALINLLCIQTKLVNTAESINNKLAYFNELERISSVSIDLFCICAMEEFTKRKRLDHTIVGVNSSGAV